VEVVFQIFLPDDLSALVALHPKPFGLHLLLAARIELLLFPLKPAHALSFKISTSNVELQQLLRARSTFNRPTDENRYCEAQDQQN
jgi:hypothetical protein